MKSAENALEAGERQSGELASALARLDEIAQRLAGRRPVVFLDYDGVLTPIVRRPEEAHISPGMRQTVGDLAGVCPVAVVSGRDLQDVKKMAGVAGIAYAGSHGFDIEGPAGRHLEFNRGNAYLPALDQAEGLLRQRLADIAGTRVERKRFAVAVHFREAAAAAVPKVAAVVEAVLTEVDGLRRTGGKMIFELRPDFAWDKGRAVLFLLEKLELDRPEILPFYLGDDLTDEDAFRALRGRGIGILVRDEDRPTCADYALESPEEVRVFLGRLAQFLGS